MAYRICYKCGKTRDNLFLEYLSVCIFCKIKIRLRKELRNIIKKYVYVPRGLYPKF